VTVEARQSWHRWGVGNSPCGSSGLWAMGCTALVDEVAAGFYYLSSRTKKKPLRRAAAEALSLHRPLAPSSVLLLETQTEMLI